MSLFSNRAHHNSLTLMILMSFNLPHQVFLLYSAMTAILPKVEHIEMNTAFLLGDVCCHVEQVPTQSQGIP